MDIHNLFHIYSILREKFKTMQFVIATETQIAIAYFTVFIAVGSILLYRIFSSR